MASTLEHFAEIEERLKELKTRRKALEDKFSFRDATMDEFKRTRDSTFNRMCEQQKKQNDEAHTRNKEILRDVGFQKEAAAGRLKEVVRNSASKTTAPLTKAKEDYMKTVERLMPQWDVQVSRQREDMLVKLQREKVS